MKNRLLRIALPIVVLSISGCQKKTRDTSLSNEEVKRLIVSGNSSIRKLTAYNGLFIGEKKYMSEKEFTLSLTEIDRIIKTWAKLEAKLSPRPPEGATVGMPAGYVQIAIDAFEANGEHKLSVGIYVKFNEHLKIIDKTGNPADIKKLENLLKKYVKSVM